MCRGRQTCEQSRVLELHEHSNLDQCEHINHVSHVGAGTSRHRENLHLHTHTFRSERMGYLTWFTLAVKVKWRSNDLSTKIFGSHTASTYLERHVR